MRAYIVDDLKASRDTLIHLLQTYCPEVVVVGDSDSIEEAAIQIKETAANILFLDINLGTHKTGFNLLDAMPGYKGEVIFVTAHEEFALKAFQYYALYYLLKPVDPKELTEAIARLMSKKTNRTKPPVVIVEIQNDKIAIPTKKGIELILLDDIIYLEGDGSYTKIIMKDEQTIRIAKNMKHVAAKISRQKQFIKVQKSFIVNKIFIRGLIRGSKTMLDLNGQYEIPVSINYKGSVLEVLNFNSHNPKDETNPGLSKLI